MRQVITILCITALLCTLAACTESGDFAPADERTQTTVGVTTETNAPEEPRTTTEQRVTPGVSAETAEQVEPGEPVGLRLNTGFIAEFGMTLSELEIKHGSVVESRVEDYGHDRSFIYRFEEGGRGYAFTVYDEEFVPSTRRTALGVAEIVCDTDRWGQRIEFTGFGGRVSDVFLGMEGVISVEDIEKIKEVVISFDEFNNSTFYTGFNATIEVYQTMFWHNDHYRIVITHEKEGVIEPDSELGVLYSPQGIW